jgi:hypothetical protein
MNKLKVDGEEHAIAKYLSNVQLINYVIDLILGFHRELLELITFII